MGAVVIGTGTVPWIPVAHRLELLLAGELPRGGATTAALALVVDAADRTLLAHVDRPGRGWDLPGGHLEPDETAAAAAVREVGEETGLHLGADELEVFAWIRIRLTGGVPDDHPYPALSHLVVFTARLPGIGPPTVPDPGSECTRAEWVTRDGVAERCAGSTWLPLHRALLR